jgi:hypothetical protein
MASRCDGFSRPHISIDWRKKPVSVSVLRVALIDHQGQMLFGTSLFATLIRIL